MSLSQKDIEIKIYTDTINQVIDECIRETNK